MITRRQFLKYTAIAGAAASLPLKFGVGTAQAVNVSLQLPKWQQEMSRFVTNIPLVSSVPDPTLPNTNFYRVTAGEFTEVLHPNMGGATHLWGYWDTTTGVKTHLGGVIAALRPGSTPALGLTPAATRIRVTNTLPSTTIIPIDTTLPGTSNGPDRIAVHLHGGYVPWISDGGPFDWWNPAGGAGESFLNGPGGVLDNIPAMPMQPGQGDVFYPNTQSTRLMWYHDHAHGITRTNAYAGIATGYLLIDTVQDGKLLNAPPFPTPLVFQDKSFVWGTAATAVAPATGTWLTDPTWFTFMPPRVHAQGSLWYEHIYDPKLFKLRQGAKFLTPPNPSCIPEFFGDTICANGLVAPLMTVPAAPLRLMILNACNARFLNMNLLTADATADGITLNPRTLFPVNAPGPNMVQIGTEGGYLAQDVVYTGAVPFNPALLTGQLLIGPAERCDIVIDFSAVTVQTDYILYNDAPGPFPAGPPTTDFFIGNTKNPAMAGVTPGNTPDTRQLLRIRVVPPAVPATPQALPIINTNAANLATTGTFFDPPLLAGYTLATVQGLAATPTAAYPTAITAPAGATLRPLTLNEDFDQYGRLRQLIGLTTPQAFSVPGGLGIEYLAQATETPTAAATEVWQVYNLSADTHPIHIHLINGQVLSRQPFRFNNGRFNLSGVPRGPQPNELGWKETFQMHPGERIEVLMKFDLPPVPFSVPASPRLMGPGATPIANANEYVYHCHILEHEEHDMMRPLVVIGTNPVTPITVTPASQSVAGAAGGTVSYAVGNVVNSTVNVAASPVPAGLSVLITATGFDVTVAAGTAAQTVTLSVGDNTNRAATATLNII